MVQAQRTYTNHTFPELCRVLFEPLRTYSTRAGWFKHSEPHRTYTLLTITELARCVGCFCSSSGWFKHSKPTRTTPSQCSRCVGHSFGVVEAQRTSSNLQETHHHRASTVCRVLLHVFGVVQALRTSSNLHEPPQHRASKVCRVLMPSFRVVQAQRTYTNHTITVLKVCRALVRGC